MKTSVLEREQLDVPAWAADSVDLQSVVDLERLAGRLAGAAVDDLGALARLSRTRPRGEVLAAAASEFRRDANLATVLERWASAHVPMHVLVGFLLEHALTTKPKVATALRSLGRDTRILDER